MKRILVVLMGLAVLASVGGVAQTAVVPRTFQELGLHKVLLFDNTTEAAVSKLAIIFDKPVELTQQSFIAFGGGLASAPAITLNYLFVTVRVDRGGTLQVILPALSADAAVVNAYWFK